MIKWISIRPLANFQRRSLSIPGAACPSACLPVCLSSSQLIKTTFTAPLYDLVVLVCHKTHFCGRYSAPDLRQTGGPSILRGYFCSFIAPQRAKRAGVQNKPIQACECKSVLSECQVPQFDGDLGQNISHKNVSYDKKSYTTTNGMD